MSLKVSLAGRVSIGTDGVLIEEERFPGRQGRLVFAYLVSEQGRPVLRDELAEALWGGAPPATWEKALAVIASKLRALLGECGLEGAKVLTSAFGCYRLELPDGSWIDLLAAAQGADQAEAELAADHPERAKAEATKAVGVARLPLLSGEDGVWVEGKRRELADVLDRALDCLAEACLRSGDLSEAAKWAQDAIALQPFRESGYRRLMRAHAAAGNRAEALQTYERCRRLLAEELGAYPSPETESIYRELLSTAPGEALVVTAEAVVAPPVTADPLDADAVLVTELGLEPSGELQELERAVLRQDPEPSAPAMSRKVLGGRRGQGGRLIAIGGALVLGAAILGAVIAFTHADGNAGILLATPNSIAVIDPETNRIVATIPVGHGPTSIAVGGGKVWVLNRDDQTISLIDATTRSLVKTFAIGATPSDLAVGAGGVWVGDSVTSSVLELDLETGVIVRTISAPPLTPPPRQPGEPLGGDIAIGLGAVWFSSGNATLTRIDPRTGRVAARIRHRGVTPDDVSSVAVGEGAVWVSSCCSIVTRIDPATNAVAAAIEGFGGQIAAGLGGVWLAAAADGLLWRIEPSANTSENFPTRTIAVGSNPLGVAVGEGSVWVANGDGTVSRVDPTSYEVTAIRVGKSLAGIAAGAGAVWVAVG